MRFKVDENLPVEAAVLLRNAGHDAVTVLEQSRGGAVDKAFQPADYPGLVVLRLRSQSKEAVLAALERLLTRLEPERIIGRLWVVQQDRVRIRS